MLDQEAKKLVNSSYSLGYEGALEQLQLTYGRKTNIYPQLVEEFLARTKYDYSRESMRLILDRTRRVLNDMEKLEGRNLDIFAVSMVTRDFDQELLTEWTKHLGEEDKLPTLDELVKFVTPLSHHLPRLTRAVRVYYLGVARVWFLSLKYILESWHL